MGFKPGTIIQGEVYLTGFYLYNLLYVKDNKLHINYLYNDHLDAHHNVFHKSLYEDFDLYTDIFEELKGLK